MKRLSLLLWMTASLTMPSQVFASDFDESATYQSLYRLLSTPYGEDGNVVVYGSGDSDMDFTRLMWYLNELSSDEATCWWTDPGLPELNTNTWDYNTRQPKDLFTFLHYGIFRANLYLENAPETLAQRRAEVRFIRALLYFHALDLYGNVPLMTSTKVNLFNYYYDYTRAAGINTDAMTQEEFEALALSYQNNTVERPKQVGCTALFDFIVSELKACEADLPQPGSEAYARPSKAAAWLLLARLYLNAQVYTGTAQWEEAKTYAKNVIDSKAYSLCPTFSHLFMGDNDSNDAKQEIIFPIYAGNEMTPSWGCTTYLIASTYDEAMPYNGFSQVWAGNRARKALVEKFDLANDIRAMFYTKGHTLEITDLHYSFSQGYAVTKFTNVRSDGGVPSNSNYADTDWPLMRFAEAYLTFAEADAHQHGGTCSDDGVEMLNKVRTRAQINELPTVTLNDIANEWAREFMFEGRRRSDLIRLGLFTGGNYLWDWKGGQQNGVAIDDYLARFPLPDVMMNLSKDYVQNLGYLDINKVQIDETFTLDTPEFASQTVSLRDMESLNFTWQEPNVSGIDPSMVTYSLQMSPTGNFGEANSEEEIISWGTYYGTYYPFSTGNVNSEELDGILQRWKRVKRYSDFSQQPIDIYFRCVATIGGKERSSSNVQKISIKPYINYVNATNWYLVGPGIGDGKQTLTSEGIGTSMLPMDIDYNKYGGAWGYMGGGMFTLITYLQKDSPFWLRQMRPGIYFYSSDGTIDNAVLIESSSSNVPSTDRMFTVSETGTYVITLNVNPDYEQGKDGEWHQLPYLTITQMDGIASGVRNVTIAGDASVTMQQSAAGNIWYGNVTLSQEGQLHFNVDGQQWGDTGSSFGYAKPGNTSMTLPAGSYVVTLNVATGFYDFYNIDDALFIWSNPYQLMSKRTFELPIKKYYYVGWLNSWKLTDDSYPLTTKEGVVYQIQIPAPTSNDGWFKIAGEEAVATGNWNEQFLLAPYDGCQELDGYFYVDSSSTNAWNLPQPVDGSTHYNLEFNMLTNRYKFTPVTPSAIREITHDGKAQSGIYTLNGVRLKGEARQLPKGLYIINGKKVVVK